MGTILIARIKQLAYDYYHNHHKMVEDGIPLALNTGIVPLDDRVPFFRAACWKLLGESGWHVNERPGEPEIVIEG